MSCRCGRATETEHPCHGDGYTCPNPGTRRVLTYPTCLAGAQFKLGAYETWACDECWATHLAQLRVEAMALQIAKEAGVKRTEGGSLHLVYEADLDAWELIVNNEIRMCYYADDPGPDGGVWVPALTDIDMSVRAEAGKAAARAIYAVLFGDADPLSKEMIGEIHV